MTGLDLPSNQANPAPNDQATSEYAPPADTVQSSGLLPVEEYRAGSADKIVNFLRLQSIIGRYATDNQAGPTIQAIISFLVMLDNDEVQ